MDFVLYIFALIGLITVIAGIGLWWSCDKELE